MSDEPPKPEPVAAAPKVPKVLVALLVLNLGSSGFTTFKVVTASPAAAATSAEHEPAPSTSEVVGPVLALDPFVVNLDEPGTSRYLKLTLQLELVSPEAEASIEKSKHSLRDAILSHLSGLHLADTLGIPAKDKLRTEIMAKIEKVVGDKKVRRVFFQEFVVQ